MLFVHENADKINQKLETLAAEEYALLQPWQLNYEIDNFRGDAHVIVTADNKTICDGDFMAYDPQIQSATDMYSFGMEMPERTDPSTGSDYRFGFGGKERDNEVKGNGNSLDFGARIYDSRLGRWLSVDPLLIKYAGLSSYNYAANSPVFIIDKAGEDIIIVDPAAKEPYTYTPGGPAPADNAPPFIKAAFKSLDHLYKNGGAEAANIISDLSKPGFDLKIYQTTETNSSFDQLTNELAYNPRIGQVVGEMGAKQSPALVLIHELDHAHRRKTLFIAVRKAQASKNPTQIKAAVAEYEAFQKPTSEQAESEEQRVTLGSESKTADALGEGKRGSYKDWKKVFATDDPTTTDEVPTKGRERRAINDTNRRKATSIKKEAKAKAREEHKR